MKKILLVFSLLIFGFIFSQEKPSNSDIETEQLAEFPNGGLNNFRKLIEENFRERKVVGKGKEFCELIYIIERDGTITDIKAKGTNKSFNKEAIRAISKIKTKWIPAKINGQAVRYRFRIPLNLTFD